MSRTYARALKGQRINDIKPKGQKQRVSLIAAISLAKNMAEQALVMSGSINKQAFITYIKTTLLPQVKKGSILVMDNWSVHKGQDIRDLVASFGCSILYLPTYSPDFNPIEYLFAKIKAHIKKDRSKTIEKLIDSYCDAACSITSDDIRNTFRHCNYL